MEVVDCRAPCFFQPLIAERAGFSKVFPVSGLFEEEGPPGRSFVFDGRQIPNLGLLGDGEDDEHGDDFHGLQTLPQREAARGKKRKKARPLCILRRRKNCGGQKL